MKKVAFFVEGYTELLFLKRLLQEVCGKHNPVIDHVQTKGGGKRSGLKKTYSLVKASKTTGQEKYYFLIFDCGGDKRVGGDKNVKSEIFEHHQKLTDEGYVKIIGIRDVRPDFSYQEIPKLETNLKKYIKTKLIPVTFVLSVMEIEAWFLAEYKHLQVIDSSLTLELIKAKLAFDPSKDDLTQRHSPREDLEKCYELVGVQYKKNNQLTTKSLDFSHIYFDVKHKFTHLQMLINCLIGCRCRL